MSAKDLIARAAFRSMLEKAQRLPRSFKEAPDILALDLDGTVLKYDEDDYKRDQFGGEIEGMVDELNEVRAAGWKIVVWTCRPNTPALRAHLKKLKVPYDYINDHPWNGPDNPRKVHATVYLDDKGMTVDGSKIKGLAKRILNFKPWWRNEQERST